jgi:hypothetical protein
VAWATPHDLDRLRASHARGRLGEPLVPTSVASPRLGDELAVNSESAAAAVRSW